MSQRLRVLQLYRAALKDAQSWAIDRTEWYKQAAILRTRFKEGKAVDNPREALALLEKGEAEFERTKHPDPYIPCTALNGSKWERNTPPPANVCEWDPTNAAH
eukprot:m.4309 g.4309  ORF g.4309 m.4309 type:complete len:103 (-) comp4459_c0_seq1:261-569(-)